jgi:catechol 2,3-dioxygenase
MHTTNDGAGEREAEGGARGVTPAGYRLPAALRLGRVTLQVADLERSLAWYGEVLGMRILDREDTRATLGAHGGDDEVLVEMRERPGAAPVPPEGRLGLFHVALVLPDRPALGRFARHLAERGVRAGASDHGVSEALYLNDPDGLGIEVYADRPRASWRYAGSELVMTTEPLDLPSLLRAGGGVPWNGMPEGSRVGHLHLSVGTVEMAGAFYHDALGFDRVVWSYPGALFLSAGGYHHYLGVNEWAPRARPAGEVDARLLEWEIVLPHPGQAAEAAASLEAHGHAVERLEPGAFRVRDPWGTALRLVAGVER